MKQKQENQLTRGSRVYISGPIRGYELEERKETFRCAQMALLGMGLVGVNPFENGLPDNRPDEEHLRMDLKMLLDCDAILMLDGWGKSVGARLELSVACHCGMPVMHTRDSLRLISAKEE